MAQQMSVKSDISKHLMYDFDRAEPPLHSGHILLKLLQQLTEFTERIVGNLNVTIFLQKYDGAAKIDFTVGVVNCH